MSGMGWFFFITGHFMTRFILHGRYRKPIFGSFNIFWFMGRLANEKDCIILNWCEENNVWHAIEIGTPSI